MWAAHWMVAGYDGEHLVYLAGLHGDDPHEVRDALPDALLDCGIAMPMSEVAAVKLVFTDFARMYIDGAADAPWICRQVEYAVIDSDFSDSVMALPLGRLYGLDDEWKGGWGRSTEQLAQTVREACEEQLRDGSVAT
jgi:hypothetical protein